MIKSNDVKVITISYFEGLYVKDLLEYAQTKTDDVVMRCLPETEKEIDKLPRAYLGNVIYTRVGDQFKEWMDERIRIRNQKLADDQNMMINMDPDIARIFRASNSVSGK